MGATSVGAAIIRVKPRGEKKRERKRLVGVTIGTLMASATGVMRLAVTISGMIRLGLMSDAASGALTGDVTSPGARKSASMSLGARTAGATSHSETSLSKRSLGMTLAICHARTRVVVSGRRQLIARTPTRTRRVTCTAAAHLVHHEPAAEA